MKDFWGNTKISTDYIAFYNNFHENFDPRYMPDDLYYSKVDTFFNKGIEARIIDDKNLYNLFFHDIKQPKTIIRKISGSYLNSTYNLISTEKAIEKCLFQKQLILKRSTLSGSGSDILFWKIEDGLTYLIKILNSPFDYIIQELVNQHSEFNRLNSSSVNTLRIMTLFLNDEVHVLSSIIRMGVNGSLVDNASSGGLFCGINKDGRLKEYAYNMKGKKFLTHPTSNKIFYNTIVPDFNRCVELVKILAPRVVGFSKIVSWDLAINELSEPILIEANLSYGGVTSHQMSNGPIFNELTKEVLNKVFINKFS